MAWHALSSAHQWWDVASGNTHTPRTQLAFPGALFAFGKDGKYVQLDWLVTTAQKVHSYARALDTRSGAPVGRAEGWILADCCQAVFWNSYFDQPAAIDFNGMLLRFEETHATDPDGAGWHAKAYPESDELKDIASTIIACMFEDRFTLLCVHTRNSADGGQSSDADTSMNGQDVGDTPTNAPKDNDEQVDVEYAVSRFDVGTGRTIGSMMVVKGLLPKHGRVVGAGWSGMLG